LIIRLSLHWGLGRYLPHSPSEGKQLILPDETSIEKLFDMHGIPAGEVGMIAVNGFLVKKDHWLNDQDDVHFYPPLEGG
jgi:hypothetical protein